MIVFIFVIVLLGLYFVFRGLGADRLEAIAILLLLSTFFEFYYLILK